MINFDKIILPTIHQGTTQGMPLENGALKGRIAQAFPAKVQGHEIHYTPQTSSMQRVLSRLYYIALSIFTLGLFPLCSKAFREALALTWNHKVVLIPIKRASSEEHALPNTTDDETRSSPVNARSSSEVDVLPDTFFNREPRSKLARGNARLYPPTSAATDGSVSTHRSPVASPVQDSSASTPLDDVPYDIPSRSGLTPLIEQLQALLDNNDDAAHLPDSPLSTPLERSVLYLDADDFPAHSVPVSENVLRLIEQLEMAFADDDVAEPAERSVSPTNTGRRSPPIVPSHELPSGIHIPNDDGDCPQTPPMRSSIVRPLFSEDALSDDMNSMSPASHLSARSTPSSFHLIDSDAKSDGSSHASPTRAPVNDGPTAALFHSSNEDDEDSSVEQPLGARTPAFEALPHDLPRFKEEISAINTRVYPLAMNDEVDSLRAAAATNLTLLSSAPIPVYLTLERFELLLSVGCSPKLDDLHPQDRGVGRGILVAAEIRARNEIAEGVLPPAAPAAVDAVGLVALRIVPESTVATTMPPLDMPANSAAVPAALPATVAGAGEPKLLVTAGSSVLNTVSQLVGTAQKVANKELINQLQVLLTNLFYHGTARCILDEEEGLYVDKAIARVFEKEASAKSNIVTSLLTKATHYFEGDLIKRSYQLLGDALFTGPVPALIAQLDNFAGKNKKVQKLLSMAGKYFDHLRVSHSHAKKCGKELPTDETRLKAGEQLFNLLVEINRAKQTETSILVASEVFRMQRFLRITNTVLTSFAIARGNTNEMGMSGQLTWWQEGISAARAYSSSSADSDDDEIKES